VKTSCKAFLATLYYRLNTVCLPLSNSLTVAAGAERDGAAGLAFA